MYEGIKVANKKLAEEGITIESEASKGGDCRIVITSRRYRTAIGCNDLGVWLIEQKERINTKLKNSFEN